MINNSIFEVHEQPAAKLVKLGHNSLSCVDLVTLIIGGVKNDTTTKGQARKLLTESGTFANLRRWNLVEYRRAGLTQAQALKMLATFEICRRSGLEDAQDKVKISCSQDIYNLVKHFEDLTHEEFHVIMMNRSNKVLETYKVSQGGISGTVVDNRLILKRALELNACNMIAAHNHPSSNIQPSTADQQITDKLKAAAKTMNINLLDHIIVGDGSYFSFSDEGLI